MKKVLIINSNYYKNISNNLIFNAKMEFRKSNIILKVINVPGIFEIPTTIRKYVNKYDGFLALGCVIKGKTPHFDLICSSTFYALMNITINFNKPITNGIITALNMKQAKERSSKLKGTKKQNKGTEAAKAMISLLKYEPTNF